MNSRHRPLTVMVFLSIPLFGAPVGAVCVGDCDGDGQVRINEVITGVNIGLDQLPLAACPSFDANDNGAVAINEVITGVNNGLTGCPEEPTPTSTPQPTPTPTGSIPDVSGTWRQRGLHIESSTCPAVIDQALEETIAEGDYDCDYALDQRGTRLDITEICADGMDDVVGSVDQTGTVTASISDTGNIDGCSVTIAIALSVPATQSPTTATATFDGRFGAGCPVASCTIVTRGTWTKL